MRITTVDGTPISIILYAARGTGNTNRFSLPNLQRPFVVTLASGDSWRDLGEGEYLYDDATRILTLPIIPTENEVVLVRTPGAVLFYAQVFASNLPDPKLRTWVAPFVIRAEQKRLTNVLVQGTTVASAPSKASLRFSTSRSGPFASSLLIPSIEPNSYVTVYCSATVDANVGVLDYLLHSVKVSGTVGP